MFRSASAIDADVTDKKLARLREKWTASRDAWFDGSAESVEKRIAQVDEVIALSKRACTALQGTKVGSIATAALPQLTADRVRLVESRREMTGGNWESGEHVESEPVSTSPGLRTAAAEFVDGQNTSDRQELLIRAQRYIEAKTSSWSREASYDAVRAFVGAVGQEVPHQPRVVQRQATRVRDFDDQLLFD